MTKATTTRAKTTRKPAPLAAIVKALTPKKVVSKASTKAEVKTPRVKKVQAVELKTVPAKTQRTSVKSDEAIELTLRELKTLAAEHGLDAVSSKFVKLVRINNRASVYKVVFYSVEKEQEMTCSVDWFNFYLTEGLYSNAE